MFEAFLKPAVSILAKRSAVPTLFGASSRKNVKLTVGGAGTWSKIRRRPASRRGRNEQSIPVAVSERDFFSFIDDLVQKEALSRARRSCFFSRVLKQRR
jgi:hypothetical protein